MTRPLTALRERIVILVASETAAALGGKATIVWQPLATIFAAVSTRNGQTVVFADGLMARTTHEVLLRWREDITTGMRITWRGRTLRIDTITDRTGRRRWLTCLCQELQP